MEKIKVPLSVYVLWHSEFKEGYSYAREIYTHFTRDIENPASRGIGIPVLFPSEEKEAEHKLDIDFDTTERVAIVLLIDGKMLLDDSWRLYMKTVQDICDKNPKFIIYPVAMIEKSLRFPVENVRGKNCIRLFEKNGEKQKNEYLIFMLAHELCRFIYGIERISEIENTITPPPIKLFLSHAKADGVEITKSIKEYINHDTPLDDFFDAQDIAPGYDFAKEIKSAIHNCMLLVIHTDQYSSRDWCKKEVLISKEFFVPILVLNCLSRLENRSFPYMSNVQTLRIKENEKINCEEIISIALLEVLRHKYQGLYIRFVLKLCGLNISEKNILSYPPELFSLVQTVDKKENIVVYPDPPLGNDELALLKRYQANLQFVTPTLVPCIDSKTKVIHELPLNGLKVGISISETDEENRLGLNKHHLQDIMVEMARYLLAEGAQLCYGGDIRYREDFNFVDILACLVKNHNNEYEEVNKKIINYVANYLCPTVSEQIQIDLIDEVEFKFIEQLDLTDDEDSSDKLYSRYIKARDLSKMRTQMNENINARIILGGKKKNYQGSYPGVLEEVILAMNTEKPVYLIGAFGGITQEIIKCIIGEETQILSKEYQSSFNEYSIFYDYYNKKAPKDGLNLIDYRSITEILKYKGIIGLNNGLTEEENKTLFESTNTIEMISLILKGLANLKNDI